MGSGEESVVYRPTPARSTRRPLAQASERTTRNCRDELELARIADNALRVLRPVEVEVHSQRRGRPWRPEGARRHAVNRQRADPAEVEVFDDATTPDRPRERRARAVRLP